MIKYFCDRCGKETNGVHICKTCENNELTQGFKIGDEVITDDGRVGTITDICTCDKCKKRGFYEPMVEMKIGSQIYITDTDKENGFISYYKIGDQVFGNIDDKYLLNHLKTYQEAIKEIEAQLDVIENLREETN
jgi:hypothetical protein